MFGVADTKILFRQENQTAVNFEEVIDKQVPFWIVY